MHGINVLINLDIYISCAVNCALLARQGRETTLGAQNTKFSNLSSMLRPNWPLFNITPRRSHRSPL